MKQLVSSLAIALIAMALASPSAVADTFRVAVVSKSLNHPFFDKHRNGCQVADRELDDVECVYAAPETPDPRLQDKIIAELIDGGIDAVAVAVINSDLLASRSLKEAHAKGIPVITYNADLAPEAANLRLAYVGTDNVGIGRRLGEQIAALAPSGGRFCIQSSRLDTPNLAERVRGAEEALAEAGGWEAMPRCPFEFRGDLGQATRQLRHFLTSASTGRSAAFLAVGGWAQFHDDFPKIAGQFKEALNRRQAILGFIDTRAIQLDYLEQRLAHVNVGQDPFEQGRQAVHVMREILVGDPYEEINHTPTIVCLADDVASCRTGKADDRPGS